MGLGECMERRQEAPEQRVPSIGAPALHAHSAHLHISAEAVDIRARAEDFVCQGEVLRVDTRTAHVQIGTDPHWIDTEQQPRVSMPALLACPT